MVIAPELQIKRFLNYGREAPFYQPGDRFLNKYFEPDCLTSVEALIAQGCDLAPPIYIIKAFSDGYSAHPESLVYALAFCTRHTNFKLRKYAYIAFKTVCKSSENLFLFVKFASDLAAPHKGWGHGWRQVVNNWYLKQNPLELAKNVTRHRGRHFWTHRDIIKLSHPRSLDIAKQAVLKYIMAGLEVARNEFGDKPDAQPVLNYLQAVEDFKHTKEEDQAARLLEMHDLTLEHIPMHLIKSKEVWAALVPRLPLDVLLRNIKRLARMHFLRNNHIVTTRVLQTLQDQTAIAECNLHPAQVLITLRNFMLSSSRFKYVETDASKPLKPLPPPNPKIIEALTQLLESSFKLLVPTGMRYLVVVDTRASMLQGKCWQCSSVPPLLAATLLTMSLVKVERDVTVMAFGIGAIVPVELTKEMSLQQAHDKLKEIPSTTMELSQPLTWATTSVKKVDVFIIITDNHLRGVNSKPCDALKEYRSVVDMPNTKFVTVALATQDFKVAHPDDPGMLDIAGFDGKVPRVIEAFSRGAF